MECYHFKIYLIKKYIFIYLKLYKFINLEFYVKYTLNHYNSQPLIKKSLVELDKNKEKEQFLIKYQAKQIDLIWISYK